MLDDLVVEVIAAEMVVAMARNDFDDTRFDPHDRRIEGAATKIIHQDALALMLRRLVDHGRRRGLVDDPHHLEPSNLAGLAGRLALGVGEIGRHSDHRFAYRPPEAPLGDVLEAFENDGGNLLRRVRVSGELDLFAAAHPAFDGSDRALRVQDELVARLLAHQQISGLPDADHRGKNHPPQLVDQHLGPAVAVHGDLRIGGAEVDPDDLIAHLCLHSGIAFGHDDFGQSQ